MKLSIRQDAAIIVLAMLIFNLFPHKMVSAASSEIVYPLKVISKLDCRFEDFDTLSSNCKETLPVLHTKDYEKYATKNGGYNDFTRLYTVLWGSSYKYGWDVGNGGHQGTDIATAKGTPVYSIADGKVIEAGKDLAWGNYISIEHTIGGKKVVSNYAHLSKITVNKGESVDVGEKIGEVGSTGNSTGNHLHFQVDLPSVFHPYYFDWSECPFSYYEITEQGVCFDVLAKHTLDPLAFLESNGAILEEIEITGATKTTNNTVSSSKTDIFNTTVYYGYGTKTDVKELQRVMKELGYYSGAITGDFSDVEKSVLNFQLSTGVITSKNDDGAGWFGPKTRTQAKKEYETFLATNEPEIRYVGGDSSKTETVVKQTVTKVSRENLLTREEIQAQEMAEFLKAHTIKVENGFSQISTGESKLSIFSIMTKKGKGFRGNTPGTVSFSYDESKISIFPKSFYNFTDGTREITITGLSEGHTTVDIKIGEVIIDTLSISVGKTGSKAEVKSAQIYGANTATIGEENKAIVLMKDGYNNKLVKKRYDGTFTLDSQNNIQYCIKKGALKDIKEIYSRDCYPEEFQDAIQFSYDDTIGGLLILEYKVLDANAKIDINSAGKSILQKNVAVTQVKNLSQNYIYYDDVMNGLMSGLVSGIDRGYFLQDNELSAQDAKNWILEAMNLGSYSQEDRNRLSSQAASKYTKMTRQEFLEMAYEYLGNNVKASQARDYKDLDSEKGVMVASILGQDYSWKDNFGEQYFQPDKKITRGEAAYMLIKVFDNMGNGFLVRR